MLVVLSFERWRCVCVVFSQQRSVECEHAPNLPPLVLLCQVEIRAANEIDEAVAQAVRDGKEQCTGGEEWAAIAFTPWCPLYRDRVGLDGEWSGSQSDRICLMWNLARLLWCFLSIFPCVR